MHRDIIIFHTKCSGHFLMPQLWNSLTGANNHDVSCSLWNINTHLVLNLEVKRSGCNQIGILTRKWLDANISSRASKYVALPKNMRRCPSRFSLSSSFQLLNFYQISKVYKNWHPGNCYRHFWVSTSEEMTAVWTSSTSRTVQVSTYFGHIVCVQQTLGLVASVFVNAK